MDFLGSLISQWEETFEDTLDRLVDIEGGAEPVPINGIIPIMAVEQFDPQTNILGGVSFPQSISSPTEYLTTITPTTVTLGGTITNVSFLEEDFIKIVEPNDDIIMIKCNYGVKTLAGYDPLQKRPHQKNPKRKKQGSGVAMCSQISFHCRKAGTEKINGVYPPDTPVYKVKVFRNGYTQVPGARPDTHGDIIRAMGVVINFLNSYLHSNENIPERLCRGINLNPLMYNYKAHLIIPPRRYFHRKALMDAVINAPYRGEYPELSTSQCSQKEPKVSFRFLNRVDGYVKDPLFVFYDSGCFNIQGAADVAQCAESCKFLARVISDNAERIFPFPESPLSYIPDNIAW